jgi:hypothetical protein
MSWLSNLLHPGRAYDKAKETSKNYYNQAQNQLNPYSQGGIAANDKLNQLFDALSNPGKLQDEWSKGYAESPYAKQLEQGSIDKGLNAAGSMGLMGSSAALNNIQEEGSDIMNKDRQQYMNDMMQKYLAGLGIATNQFNTGAGAAGQQSQNAMNQGANEAGLDFGKSNAGSNMLMQLINSITQGGNQYLTGGMGKGSFGRGAFTPETPIPNYYGQGMFLPPNGGR